MWICTGMNPDQKAGAYMLYPNSLTSFYRVLIQSKEGNGLREFFQIQCPKIQTPVLQHIHSGY